MSEPARTLTPEIVQSALQRGAWIVPKAIMHHPTVGTAARTLWAAIWQEAGCRPGKTRTSFGQLAALLQRSTRSLENSKGKPGPVAQLEQLGAIDVIDVDERRGLLLYVYDPDEVGQPSRHDGDPQQELFDQGGEIPGESPTQSDADIGGEIPGKSPTGQILQFENYWRTAQSETDRPFASDKPKRLADYGKPVDRLAARESHRESASSASSAFKNQKESAAAAQPAAVLRAGLGDRSDWKRVEQKLVAAGVVMPRKAIECAKRSGIAPQSIADLIDYALTIADRFEHLPPVLFRRIQFARAGQKFDEAWPATSQSFERVEKQRSRELNQQKQRREQATERQQQTAADARAAELERKFGRHLDALNAEQLEQMIAENAKANVLRRFYRPGAPINGILRETLIVQLAERLSPPHAPQGP